MKTSGLTVPIVWFFVIVSLVGSGCGKSSGLKGKVVDSEGKPLADLKVIAEQVRPIKKGYKRFDASTDSNGMFLFETLYASSEYVLTVWPKNWLKGWSYSAKVNVTAGPRGETVLLEDTIVTRFSVSAEEVIADSKFRFEWFVGPMRQNYRGAVAWVDGLAVAGGGWRMPKRVEVAILYQKKIIDIEKDILAATAQWWFLKESSGMPSFGEWFGDIGPKRAIAVRSRTK